MTRSQSVGGAVLSVLAIVVLAVLYTHPVPVEQTEQYRRDSIRAYWDSVYAHQDSVREYWRVFYDSVFARRDSLRAYWDSVRVSDTLRRSRSLRADTDSVVRRFPVRLKLDTVVELNTADTSALMCIYGIGHYTAVQIVQYRRELGGYYDPRQILEIPTLRSERQQLLLDSALHHLTACPDSIRRLPVNRCSVSRLMRHPYLSAKQADAIYRYRRQQIRLRSLDDLTVLSSLDSLDLHRLQYYLSFD